MSSPTKERMTENRNKMLASDPQLFREALALSEQILHEMRGHPMPSPYDPSCTSKIEPGKFLERIASYITQAGVKPDLLLKALETFSSRFLTHYKGRMGAGNVSKLLSWMTESIIVKS